MADARSVLIDTAARAAFAHEWGDRWTWEAAAESDHAYWLAHAEAVIEALGITRTNPRPSWAEYVGWPVFRVACLEAPAIQTHDSEETTR